MKMDLSIDHRLEVVVGTNLQKKKVDIIPSTELAMQLNDVRNDPYFIVQ